jgi:hypothetical protein
VGSEDFVVYHRHVIMPMKRILVECSSLCQADSQTDRINRTLVSFGDAIDVADQELESELEAEREYARALEEHIQDTAGSE